jgi:hypothetical protein
VDRWLTAAYISTGPIFRAINKAKRIRTSGFSPKVIWGVVKAGSAKCGLNGVAPHDLRRTCARLCHEASGELEQIQFLPVTSAFKQRNAHRLIKFVTGEGRCLIKMLAVKNGVADAEAVKFGDTKRINRSVRKRYQQATLSSKTAILDEFVEVTGYHRKHAVRSVGAKWGL